MNLQLENSAVRETWS